MQPKGFWSYAQGDDAHLDGVLTDLRQRLEGNCFHGIVIKDKADPDLQRCAISSNTRDGAFCYEAGHGRFNNCEFSRNGCHGLETQEGGRPVLQDCRLVDNKKIWILRC